MFAANRIRGPTSWRIWRWTPARRRRRDRQYPVKTARIAVFRPSMKKPADARQRASQEKHSEFSSGLNYSRRRRIERA